MKNRNDGLNRLTVFLTHNNNEEARLLFSWNTNNEDVLELNSLLKNILYAKGNATNMDATVNAISIIQLILFLTNNQITTVIHMNTAGSLAGGYTVASNTNDIAIEIEYIYPCRLEYILNFLLSPLYLISIFSHLKIFSGT